MSVFKKNHISTDRYLLLIGTDRSISTNLLESTIAYIWAWASADCDLIDITGLFVPQFLLKASECFVERTLTYDSCVFYTLRRVRKTTDLKILKSTFRTVTSTPSPSPNPQRCFVVVAELYWRSILWRHSPHELLQLSIYPASTSQ
jgi:hypothetical protein